MVAELARLKLLLTWNGLKKDWQRRIGLPAVVIAMGWIAWKLASGYIGQHGLLTQQQAGEFSMWAALGFFIGWVALPVVIFPLDETLDPAQLSVFPVPRPRLLLGLAIASLIGPSVVVPAVLIGSNVWVQSGWAQLVAVMAGVIFIAQMAVASHLFTGLVSALLRSRRGRDLAVMVVVGIGLFTFGGYQLVTGEVERMGVGGALAVHQIAQWAPLLPPVAAQRAVVEAQAGNWPASLSMLAVAGAWLLIMSKAWGALLSWMLVTPDHTPRPDRARHRRGLAERGLWGPRWVLARKELRFYVRDPRQRLVWTGTVIFVGLAVAVLVVGTESMAQFRNSTWLPLLAPAMVLFVGLPIALNQFGWERNAASYLFVLPIKPRHLLHGKNMAIVLGLATETLFLAILLAIFSGSWNVLKLVPALAVAAIGSQLAVGNLVSVISPLRLPREGTDVFAQASEQGCLALVAQMVSFMLIGLLMVPPSVSVVLTVSFGQVISPLATTLFATAWGAFLYISSLYLAAWILRRRSPEIVNWVQTH